MGLEEITAVFEADESVILVLPVNAKTSETDKGKWELPRFETISSSEEDYKKAFSAAYGIPLESLNLSMADRLRGFVSFSFRENPNKIFDRFDIRMIKINPSLYKSCIFTGKAEAAERLTPKDRDLMNSYS